MAAKLIIAIDGFSGTGKSSTARKVAEILGYTYVDTGAMYRAVTKFFLDNRIDIDSDVAISGALTKIRIAFRRDGNSQNQETYLNGQNVEIAIRDKAVSDHVSEISAISAVRSFLVAQQQEWGANGGIVMDGRDIGTVVFPQAEIKIFMSADDKTRAERRVKELESRGLRSDYTEVLENLLSRDQQDTSRSDSPLKKAEDAFVIDTSNITFEQQVQKVLDIVSERLDKRR